MGAPSTYTVEIANIICDRMAKGEALRDICGDADMPGYSTVTVWKRENEQFQAMYARAREERAEWLADELVYIADTETDSAKARNRIDARKWAAAKLNPKRYADRTDSTTTLEAGDGMAGLLAKLTVGRVFPKSENTDEA